MTWRISVDRRACGASGMCTGIAPGRFAVDERAAWPVAEEIEPDDAVLEAAELCPLEAITIAATDGSRVYPAEEDL